MIKLGLYKKYFECMEVKYAYDVENRKFIKSTQGDWEEYETLESRDVVISEITYSIN